MSPNSTTRDGDQDEVDDDLGAEEGGLGAGVVGQVRDLAVRAGGSVTVIGRSTGPIHTGSGHMYIYGEQAD